MPSNQTLFSELIVGASIAGLDYSIPSQLSKIIHVDIMDQQLYLEELTERQTGSADKQKSIQSLAKAGERIRSHLINAMHISQLNVEWTGKHKMPNTSTVAKDLNIVNANWRVSVKENADVFINGSPVKIFEDLPKGQFGSAVRGGDWFIQVAHSELNDYFLACDGPTETGYTTIRDFYQNVKGASRKQFGKHVAILHKNKDPNVLRTYTSLCQKVSIESAQLFNNNLNTKYMNLLFEFFFKINGVPYILAGTENNKDFAVEIPTTGAWGRSYAFDGIRAFPKPAGQPEVLLEFTFTNKASNESFVIPIKIEIRWSHGKFCGNPEAKAYKMWSYASLPWSRSL